MAFADLNLAGLAWQNRGLQYLLQDTDIPDFASQHLASAMIQAKGQQGGRQKQATASAQSASAGGRPESVQRSGQIQPSGRHDWQSAPWSARGQTASSKPGNKAAKHAWPSKLSGNPGQADQSIRSGQAWQAGQTGFGNHKPVAQPEQQILPPEQWPVAWQQRLAKTRPGRIVWTYRELGRDFLSGNDPATVRRREFFGRLIRDLSHPAGSHTFWPACLPVQGQGTGQEDSPGENRYDPPVFWSGLKKLGARGIVVMDREVASAIGLPDSIRPLQQIMHNGFFVWFLWDAEAMSNDLERYGSMLAYLRSTLRMIVHH